MKTPREYWLDGFTAAEQGLPETACPLLFKAWPRDAWMKGYAFYCEFSQARLRHEPEVLQRVNKTPFDQGIVAFDKEIDRADCPYDIFSKDGIAWIEGWDFAEHHNEDQLSAAVGLYNALKVTLIAAVICGLLWALYHSPSAWQSGYKACTSADGKTLVTCKR